MFWADAALEPKRKYKFLFQIDGDVPGVDIPAFLVKSVKKPSWEVGEAEHHFLNHTFYYPGKVKWSEMECTVVDPTDVSARLMKLLVGSGYPLPAGAENGTAQMGDSMNFGQAAATSISKMRAVGSLGRVTLSQLAPIGKLPMNAGGRAQIGEKAAPNEQELLSEQWTLHNAWLKNVDFGDLSYEDEGMAEITMTIRYDWAVLTEVNNPSLLAGGGLMAAAGLGPV